MRVLRVLIVIPQLNDMERRDGEGQGGEEEGGRQGGWGGADVEESLLSGLPQDVAGHAGVEASVLGVHTLYLVAVGVPGVRALPQQYHTL